MLLDRIAKFGFVGAIGVTAISLGTLWLTGIVWANRIAGYEGRAKSTILIVVAAGVAVNVLFLFVVIGAYVDRELEARGLSVPEE